MHFPFCGTHLKRKSATSEDTLIQRSQKSKKRLGCGLQGHAHEQLVDEENTRQEISPQKEGENEYQHERIALKILSDIAISQWQGVKQYL